MPSLRVGDQVGVVERGRLDVGTVELVHRGEALVDFGTRSGLVRVDALELVRRGTSAR